MKKAIIVGVGLLILILWGDAVAEAALHVAEILLEIIELILETVLEALLSLNPYESKAVTGWLGLGVLVFLVVLGLKRAAAATQRARATIPVWWTEEKKRLRAAWDDIGWPAKGAGLLFLFLIVLLFF